MQYIEFDLFLKLMSFSLPVKKKVISKDLKAQAQGLWGLLPAFCYHPINMHKNIKSLVKLLIPLLKEDSFMVQNIAIAVQVSTDLLYKRKWLFLYIVVYATVFNSPF